MQSPSVGALFLTIAPISTWLPPLPSIGFSFSLPHRTPVGDGGALLPLGAAARGYAPVRGLSHHQSLFRPSERRSVEELPSTQVLGTA